ncbi:MAG: hypothetical protein JNN08_06165 [Bryobacterales bacterium]|nr:hypothetical protein [Bryobacterales bacterium]
MTRGILLTVFLAAAPTAALAFSNGPVPERTGAPVDGGINCSACHRGNAINDGIGRLTILVRDYRPGVKQRVRVVLEHPEAQRWGFQITARLAGNPAQQAGTFAVTDSNQVRCADGTAAPCNGQREFAEHFARSTYPGQRGRAVWDLEWTPPSPASGEVIFYAAGNAANNNAINTGDFIYTTSTTIAAQNCNLTTAPRISSIRHGASFLDGPYAMNTMITLGGTGFQRPGQSFTAEGQDLVDNRFPAEASCVAVEVAGRRAALTYLDAGQINAQIPTIGDLGPVPVRVIANPGLPNELRSDAVNITLVENAPAFFRLLPTPCIAGVFQDGAVTGDPSLLPFTKGAKAGDILSLYATGLGVTEPVYQAGEIPGGPVEVKMPIQLEWNGVVMDSRDILYVGLAPGNITGLYQINIRVPAVARANIHNQLRIRQGSRLSPENTTLYIAP